MPPLNKHQVRKQMKFYLLILLLAFPAFSRNHPSTAEYIAIEHTGPETYPIKTVIISTSRTNRAILECGDLQEVNPFTKKPLTGAQQQAMQRMHCDFVLTDHSTYDSVWGFVQQNPSYFTTSINENNGYYFEYSITVKGKVYGCYLTKWLFFTSLITHLQKHQGDKMLIERLRAY
jgi:hypothetical protein